MLRVKVDHSDPALLQDQIAGEIRRAIAEEEVAPGERLPPARDLAAILGVNANTVLAALRRLREEGLLEFGRGRGVRVAAGGAPRSRVAAMAQELVELARREGYRKRELIDLLEQLA